MPRWADSFQLTPYGQELACSCLKMARSMARDLGRRLRLDPDEAESAALWALCRAAVNFNPQLGWKFSTYAWHAVRRFLKQTADRRHGPGEVSLEAAQSAEREGSYGGDGTYTWHDPPAPERAAPLGELAELAGGDAWLLRERYERGLTLAEVAGRLGVTREAVRQRQERAIGRVRGALAGPA